MAAVVTKKQVALAKLNHKVAAAKGEPGAAELERAYLDLQQRFDAQSPAPAPVKKKAAPRRLVVTLPDGKDMIRTTGRNYTHAVVYALIPGDWGYAEGCRWHPLGWTTTLPLAEKLQQRHSGRGREVRILAVREA